MYILLNVNGIPVGEIRTDGEKLSITDSETRLIPGEISLVLHSIDFTDGLFVSRNGEHVGRYRQIDPDILIGIKLFFDEVAGKYSATLILEEQLPVLLRIGNSLERNRRRWFVFEVIKSIYKKNNFNDEAVEQMFKKWENHLPFELNDFVNILLRISPVYSESEEEEFVNEGLELIANALFYLATNDFPRALLTIASLL